LQLTVVDVLAGEIEGNAMLAVLPGQCQRRTYLFGEDLIAAQVFEGFVTISSATSMYCRPKSLLITVTIFENSRRKRWGMSSFSFDIITYPAK
jgi:hypothetical protein